MAIPVSLGFNITNNSPIDEKLIQTSTLDRDAIPSYQRYDGMVVYVTSEQKSYRLEGGIDDVNWRDFPSTASTAQHSRTSDYAAYADVAGLANTASIVTSIPGKQTLLVPSPFNVNDAIEFAHISLQNWTGPGQLSSQTNFSYLITVVSRILGLSKTYILNTSGDSVALLNWYKMIPISNVSGDTFIGKNYDCDLEIIPNPSAASHVKFRLINTKNSLGESDNIEVTFTCLGNSTYDKITQIQTTYAGTPATEPWISSLIAQENSTTKISSSLYVKDDVYADNFYGQAHVAISASYASSSISASHANIANEINTSTPYGYFSGLRLTRTIPAYGDSVNLVNLTGTNANFAGIGKTILIQLDYQGDIDIQGTYFYIISLSALASFSDPVFQSISRNTWYLVKPTNGMAQVSQTYYSDIINLEILVDDSDYFHFRLRDNTATLTGYTVNSTILDLAEPFSIPKNYIEDSSSATTTAPTAIWPTTLITQENGSISLYGNITSTGNITAPQFLGSASYATDANVSIQSTSASYSQYSDWATTASFAISSSMEFVVNSVVSSSFASSSFYSVSASFASSSIQSVSASFASSSIQSIYALSASFASSSIQSIYALSASFASSSIQSVYTLSASYASASIVSTNSSQSISASYASSSISSSYALSASYAPFNLVTSIDGLTGGTINGAVTASVGFYGNGQYITGIVSSSYALSSSLSSNALTSSTYTGKYNITRTLPSLNSYVDIGNFSSTNGVHNLIVTLTTYNNEDIKSSKTYLINCSKGNVTNATWYTAYPIASTGAITTIYGAGELDLMLSVNQLNLRLRNATTTPSSTVLTTISIVNCGNLENVFTESSSTGVSGLAQYQNFGAWPSSIISQYNNQVFISGSVTASLFNGNLIGSSSYAPTASYVLISQTASFVTASNVIGVVNSSSYAITSSYTSLAVSSSYAITASYAENVSNVQLGATTMSFYELPVHSAKLASASSSWINAGNQNWELIFDKNTTATWQFRMPSDYSCSLKNTIQYYTTGSQSGDTAVHWKMSLTSISSGSATVVTQSVPNIIVNTTIPFVTNQGRGLLTSCDVYLTSSTLPIAKDFIIYKLERTGSSSDTAVGAIAVVSNIMEWIKS